MGTPPVRPRIRSRRIVERPRLVHLLDRSRARVRTLVAGPGYGKTVLLEQWAPRDDRRVGWYRARRSAADVAVVARGIQAAAAPVLPDAGRRMLERLSVTEDPEREAVLLGEMLAEDLVDWPDDAWIVIDDYQHLTVAEGPERFVEVLATRSPVQLLLASRERPLWVHAKALLYGDVLEITQSMLAMTTEEADQVLEGGQLDLSSGLLTLADGWPAVIGLAGMAPEVTEIDADMPETLYAFFADEVYRGLDPDLAEALGILAAMPTVDRELAAVLLGTERALRVCDEALALGILDDRDGRLELHPLAAAFMAQRARQVGVPGIGRVVEPALAVYRGRKDWDSAIEIAASHGDTAQLSGLLLDSLDELLRDSRLSSLEACASVVAAKEGESAAVRLARGSLALRQGASLSAQSLAESLVGADDLYLQFRGALLAGAAAHAGSRERAALAFFQEAEESAPDPEARREARWGRLMAATALELPDAPDLLAELVNERQGRASPLDVVREADKRIALGLRFGAVTTLAESREAAELLALVDNPVVRASFRATYSCALNLAADYGAALRIANELREEASELRIDFALPYASLMRAGALAGLRRTSEAHEALDDALVEAARCSDSFAQQGVYAGRVRLLLQEGHPAEACSLEPPDVSRALPGMRGEVLASRALALACLGRFDEALELKSVAQPTTNGIEARVLALCVDSVVATMRRDDGFFERLREMVETAYAVGGVDLVITAYRASPEILSALLQRAETAELTGYIVRRAEDADLARSVGVGITDALDPMHALSSRQREVHDLVCQGMKIDEIAKALFISPATVKAHLNNTYDKLGVRSQKALILAAASRARAQAAPNTGSFGASASGGDDSGT